MTSPLVVANNVASQLAANIGPSDTALLVTAGQGVRFPVISGGQHYFVTLIHFTTGAIEVVKVTSRSADTLTMVRGQDNTTPISFTTGSIVEMRLNSQIIRDIDYRTLSNTALNALVLDAGGKVADGFLSANVPIMVAGKIDLANIPNAVATDAEVAAGYLPITNPTANGTLTVYSIVVDPGGAGAGKLYVGNDSYLRDIDVVGTMALCSVANPAHGWLNFGDGSSGPCRFGYDGVTLGINGNTIYHTGNLNPASFLSLAGGTIGILGVTSTISANGLIYGYSGYVSNQNYSSNSSAVVLATGAAGIVYLRPNGAGNATGEMTVSNVGNVSAPNFIASSDRRLKKLVRKQVVREDLADVLTFKSWVMKRTGEPGIGYIAQQVQDVAPEHVHRDPAGFLGVDKAGLALEMCAGLAARLRRLEASHA